MNAAAFIAKWRANTRHDRAGAQEHFLDLCGLLDEPTPNSDPTGSAYAFEKGTTKASGGEGWADVWRRGRFAWEYKVKHKDLEAAHRQLLQYAGALENPPLEPGWTGCTAALNQAVAAAYRWPDDLSNDEILSRLLALNLARAEA